MEKGIAITGVIVGLGAISTGLYLYFHKKNGSQTKTTQTNPAQKTQPVITTHSSEFPIGIGSTGQKVKDIQNYVNSTNIVSPALIVDGVFGNLTAAGVKATGYSVPVSQNDYNKMTAASNLPTATADNTNWGNNPPPFSLSNATGELSLPGISTLNNIKFHTV